MAIKDSGPQSELAEALFSLRRLFVTTGGFSFIINMLLLVPAIYMLQIYDRVLSSRSESTLLMLTVVVLGLYALMAGLEWVRSQLLVRAGSLFDARMNARVFTASFEANLRRVGASPSQSLNDLTHVRQFFTGSGAFAFFDAPWFPIYLAVIFLLHPWLGLLATIGAALLIILALINEWVTRGPLSQANAASIRASNYAANNLRNAEVIEAMGMLLRVRARWHVKHQEVLALQALASERASQVTAVSKFIRISLQSLILGLGALLAVQGHVSAGAMIAASILMGRALAPVEQLISSWKHLISARTAYQRLNALLGEYPQREQRMALPAPKGQLAVEGVVATAPGGRTPIIKGVSFAIQPGSILGIVGPSASGKSTLARLLVGVWPTTSGTVRLDGADIFRWDKEQLGGHIGYLPQDVELFEGTIAENISRFGDPEPDKVIEAARQAGVHDMILGFPDGYDTSIGIGGSFLSGGQRQRIALARALYGQPAVIVLDEPNSNLDDAGEAALVQAVVAQKEAGRTVIVITHRTSILAAVDLLMLLRDGTVQLFGPRQQVLATLSQAAQEKKAAIASQS
ncbi:type I secretion system permease/ATPase [Immundisolibacter sp.]|uniref:type I secretion system permease/ATPase n=1 Tax=Immundisolibacter sp. TaxID=1934948 RepID=UPI003564EA0B